MNMPVDLIYGSPNSRVKLHNYDCYCSYVEDLRNSMVDAYFRTRTCLGDAANTQKMYYDRDTTLRHFKKETVSFIGINEPLCKPCLVVGPVPS